MRLRCLFVVVCGLLTPAVGWAAEPPELVRARALYNSADYDGAIVAAGVARSQPGAADAAALVLARAHLERYRRTSEGADLVTARDALGSVRAFALGPRDQVDLLVGFGQSLYFSDMFGAAADVFDTALGRGALLSARDRLLLLDWWASSLDRDAYAGPLERRARAFERIASRMEEELRADPGNAAANYWFAAAARGAGNAERAWSAAIAAWVRASLTSVTASSLRADLDRLVTEALIPDRVRSRPVREQQEAAAMLHAEWDLVKQQWK
jgi:hypothetical protein